MQNPIQAPVAPTQSSPFPSTPISMRFIPPPDCETSSVTHDDGSWTISTAKPIAFLDILTDFRNARDPAATPPAMRPFRYRYSVLIHHGSVTFRPDRTMTLQSGEVFIVSHLEYGPATKVSQIFILYPLIIRNTVQAGSVSTAWIARVVQGELELINASADTAKTIWMNANCETIPGGGEYLLRKRTNDGGKFVIPATGSHRDEPLSAPERSAIASLRALADAFGVKE